MRKKPFNEKCTSLETAKAIPKVITKTTTISLVSNGWSLKTIENSSTNIRELDLTTV